MSDNNNNDVLSKIVKDYLDRNDWRVNENSNVNYSLSGLNNYISGEVIKNYWLREIYSDEIGKAHADGDFHIHDLAGCRGSPAVLLLNISERLFFKL